MSNKSELAEYGLIIPDSKLEATICPTCRQGLRLWPAKDWVGCTDCLVSYSRFELCRPGYLGVLLHEDAKAKAAEMLVHQRLDLQTVWDNLSKDETDLNRLWPYTSQMTRHVRLVRSKEDYQRISKAATGQDSHTGSIAFPALAIRLDDLPGRMTGIAVVFRFSEKNEFFCEKFCLEDAMCIGFREANTAQTPVFISDMLDVLRVQSRLHSTGNALTPIMYKGPSTTNDLYKAGFTIKPVMAYHWTNSFTVLQTRYVDGKFYRYSPDTSRTSDWLGLYDAAVTGARHWVECLADLIEMYQNQKPEIAKILKNFHLSDEELAAVRNHLPLPAAYALSEVLKVNPSAFTHGVKGVILDDNVSWKKPNGDNILSVGFTILSVSKDERDRISYRCQIKTADQSCQFSSGRELERDAFAVIIREGLIAGIPVLCDRSYSKYGVEIATSLRQPAVKTQECPASADA